MLPQRLRTYLVVNAAIALLMGIVLAVRTDLRSGRHFFVDLLLILVFSSMLAALTLGQIALVEIYLYRKKKGTWYEWRNRKPRPPRDIVSDPDELAHRRREAFRARLSRADAPADVKTDRTRLFETYSQSDPLSRASLLLNVAEKLERSGKRQAAERCYRQIAQRFADSPEAKVATVRLVSTANS
jgi:hypothetical protein